MKYILILLFVYLNAWNQQQLDVLYKTFNKAKEFNLEYTMSAIALQESDLGNVLINVGSHDCGVFQVNVDTLSSNRWKRNKLCTRLIKDYDFSFSIALSRFKYFYNYYISKGYSKNIAWKYAIESYHSGFNRTKGIIYYKGIIKNIRIIRNFMYKLD